MALVLLLTGSLLPQVAQDMRVSQLAALVTGLLVFGIAGAPLLRGRLHPVLLFIIPLFSILAIPLILGGLPTTDYGMAKVLSLFTSTLLSGLAACLILDNRDLKHMAIVWVVVGAVLALATFTEGISLVSRARAFDSNPIWVARALSSAGIAVAWLGLNKHIRPWLATGILLVLLAATFVSGSRGPFFALVISLTALSLLSGRSRKPTGVVAAHAVLVILLMLALFAPTVGMLGRIIEVVTDPRTSFEQSQRQALWSSTLPVIGGNPGGVGYGNWQASTGLTYLYPHNLFLETTAELGWLPGLLIVLITATVMQGLAARARLEPAVQLVLVLLLAETLSVSVSGDVNARTFFMMLTLGYLTLRRQRNRNTAKSPIKDTRTPSQLHT